MPRALSGSRSAQFKPARTKHAAVPAGGCACKGPGQQKTVEAGAYIASLALGYAIALTNDAAQANESPSCDAGECREATQTRRNTQSASRSEDVARKLLAYTAKAKPLVRELLLRSSTILQQTDVRPCPAIPSPASIYLVAIFAGHVQGPRGHADARG
jgi:hypothetical protein